MKLLPSALTLGRWAATVLLAVSMLGVVPVAAQSSAEIAIQDVIQRGNAAQVQAVSTRDPTLLADTSVGTYSQQLIRTNQSLIDSGVQVIELVDLEWGPISVNGSNASATTIETWRTSFSEGPTDFTRARNVYSLVRDSGGDWRITANEHPDGRTR